MNLEKDDSEKDITEGMKNMVIKEKYYLKDKIDSLLNIYVLTVDCCRNEKNIIYIGRRE